MQFGFSNQARWRHGTLQLRAGSSLDSQPVSDLDLQPVFRHFAQQRPAVKALQRTPRSGKAGYAFLGEGRAGYQFSFVVFQREGTADKPFLYKN